MLVQRHSTDQIMVLAGLLFSVRLFQDSISPNTEAEDVVMWKVHSAVCAFQFCDSN